MTFKLSALIENGFLGCNNTYFGGQSKMPKRTIRQTKEEQEAYNLEKYVLYLEEKDADEREAKRLRMTKQGTIRESDGWETVVKGPKSG